ncbi:MAG: ribonuclease H-like domain-containing protein [Chloroflexi bacterium]|nr:ribonuclease H-like domain-containing protein [Chloroflexota bacterium]
MVNRDLQKRLRRLGALRKEHQARRQQITPARHTSLEDLPGAAIQHTDFGPCFQTQETLTTQQKHGPHRLGDWLNLRSDVLASVVDTPQLETTDLSDYVFLDTETTGLGGGAFAFQVGIGIFEPNGDFTLKQYFLRDPAEEAAMLHILSEILTQGKALVTFNGRSFDVPLLTGRYIMNRLPGVISSLPNLDLLGPARRLWRRRLPSCALSALEKDVLSVRRTTQDVPGWAIPQMYQRYLQTGDSREMVDVLYHNRIDILSMVTLAVEIHNAFAEPRNRPFDDLLSLGRWYEKQAMVNEAESVYRDAANAAHTDEDVHEALNLLAGLLKRHDRREEAAPVWEKAAALCVDCAAHEELAKYHEWHTRDLRQALHWTDKAVALASGWRRGVRQKLTLNTLEHRRSRLLNKIARQ